MSNISSDRAPITSAASGDATPLDLGLDCYRSVGDIDVTITAELGRRLITLHQLLRLRVDDVLVFSRPIGEHVDLFAGNVLIGAAEILATDEKLAIRVAELLDKPTPSYGQDLETRQAASSVVRERLVSDAA
jgi:flagellar motor switch/type III secretory pathway protein FliN